MTENEIEDAVWNDADKLGYRSAYAIRNVRIGPEQGQVDLALFPRIGKKKIVLVEVKRSTAEESKCKVVGQIIMYLTGAVQLSLAGIKCYRDYARSNPKKALATQKTSPKQVTGAESVNEAWKALCKGAKVRPDQIALYIATDGPPRPQVKAAIDLLADHYGLHIGFLQVSKHGVEIIRKSP
jgi:hypothetical protein